MEPVFRAISKFFTIQYDSMVSANALRVLITKIGDGRLRSPDVAAFDFEDARFLTSPSFSQMVCGRLGTLYSCRILARGLIS